LKKDKESDYSLAFKRLQARWPHCRQHNGYCYIENEGRSDAHHYKFEVKEWSLWALSLSKGAAVEHYPPRTPEFEAIFAIHYAKNKKKGGHRRSSSDHTRHIPNIIYHFGPASQLGSGLEDNLQRPRRHSNPFASSPIKDLTVKSNANRSQRRSILEILKERGYRPHEYTTTALYDYLTWLSANLPGKYLQYYNDLSEKEIGVDMFKESHLESTFNDIQLECPHISRATAHRITNNCREWLQVASGPLYEVNSTSDLSMSSFEFNEV
jgi:hypothetical protein